MLEPLEVFNLIGIVLLNLVLQMVEKQHLRLVKFLEEHVHSLRRVLTLRFLCCKTLTRLSCSLCLRSKFLEVLILDGMLIL